MSIPLTQDTTSPVLCVQQLTKRYRKLTAIDDLSFTINAGEFVGFIGPNGAGKSTTMGCIAGILNPDEGSVFVQGIEVARKPVEARKLISFVPQHLELYKHLTGAEYLGFVADIRGLAPEVRDAQIEELLKLAELSKARHRLIKEYSGGMERKIAICAALLGPPKLLLLDESFVGLDPESTWRIRAHLTHFCAQGGAILLSSHILDMLERMCSRVVMLVSGKLATDTPMTQLKEAFDAPDNTPTTLTEFYLEKSGKLNDLK